jgi:Flp pilus assembly protein CpaB
VTFRARALSFTVAQLLSWAAIVVCCCGAGLDPKLSAALGARIDGWRARLPCALGAELDDGSVCVAVATRELPAGHRLDPDDVFGRWLPRFYVLETHVRLDPSGRVVLSPVHTGEYLRDERLRP